MQIINRYLLRQFVQVYGITFASLLGLYVVFDAFSNLDEFLEAADGSTAKLLSVIADYYAFQSLYMFERLYAIMTLISAMFTLTWIQRFNELTALQAAGISMRRVMVPILIGAVGASASGVVVRELMIPRYKAKLSRTPRDLKGAIERDIQPRYDHLTDILLQGQTAHIRTRKIDKPNFILPPELMGRHQALVAQEAEYLVATPEHHTGYLLRGVQRPAGLCNRKSLVSASAPESPVVITPVDAPWLAEDECFVVSALSLEALAGGDHWRQLSSTPELIAAVHNPSLNFGANVRVSVHARIVQPALDMVLLFLGLPFVLTGENRNVFLALGVCFVITGAFMVTGIGCHWLGAVSLLTPALAAWLPLILFVPLAVLLSERIWK